MLSHNIKINVEVMSRINLGGHTKLGSLACHSQKILTVFSLTVLSLTVFSLTVFSLTV